MPEQRWGPKASVDRLSESQNNLTWHELLRMNMHFRDENDRLREKIEDLEQKAYEASAREAKAKLGAPKPQSAKGSTVIAVVAWLVVLGAAIFVIWK